MRSGRQLIGGLAAATVLAGLLALTGCGSDTAPNGRTNTATVTNSAPSIWPSAAASAGQHEGASGQQAGAGSDAGRTTSPSLPGLSEACGAAIHAQAAVNKLFSDAMGVPGAGAGNPDAGNPGASGSGSAAPSAGSSAAGDPAAPVTASAAPTAPPTPLISANDVESTFDKISGTIPSVLTDQFTTLRSAAEKAATEPPAKIPDILARSKVADAMTDVASYIRSCQPAQD